MTNDPVKSNIPPAERLLQLEVRARRLLGLVIERSRRVEANARQAQHYLFEYSDQPATTGSFSNNFSEQDAQPVDIEIINRHAREWKAFIPADADTRAALIQLLSQDHIFDRQRFRRLQTVLGFDDPSVRQAYEDLYGAPFDGVYKRSVDTVSTAATNPEDSNSSAYSAIAEEWKLDNENVEWITLRSGETLYNPGDPGDNIYIIINGRVRAEPVNEFDGATEYGRGEIVGEVEGLTGENRLQRIFAVRDSELICLTPSDLERFSTQNSGIAWRMMQQMARRLKGITTAQKRDGNTVSTFAVAPAGKLVGNSEVAAELIGDFANQFAQALGSFGPTLLIDSASLDRQVSPGWSQTSDDSADSAWLAAYLDEQETHYRYVVYVTDPDDTQWTRRSLRQADRILLVAQSVADPLLGEIERLTGATSSHVEQHLVLLYSADTRHPAGTRRWLDRREVHAHYHVRRGHSADLGRMVRILTGRGRGLVLSGGGARGYAHLGVLRALQAAGIEIDMVGGTSMGALIGAVFAMDMDERRLMELVNKLSSPFKLFDLTLPLVSFFKSEKINEALQKVFAETQMEDLWRPFFCVSSSLTHAKTVVHTRGNLWESVRASSAIPGVFSPLLIDGELLVDGAVLNNLPVDVMREFSDGGPVIGVNVFPEVDLEREYNFGSSVSGWDVLLRKLNPLANSVPAPLIFENILRVIALNDVRQAKAKSQLCDLYITPPVASYGILQFQSYEKIIEIGYRAGLDAIERWSAADGDRAIGTGPTEAKSNRAVDPELPAAENLVSRLDHSLEKLELVLKNLAA